MADGDAALIAPSILEAVHAFTVDDYHRMAEAGILSADERTELIEGVVVTMSPIGAPHFVAVLRLEKLLRDAVGERALVSVQGPVRLPPRSEPQPDLALLRPPVDRYEAVLPGPADVFLLVEVSDSTLARDRDVKAPLYAAHGIPEYWLVDLEARHVLVHRDPLPAERRWQSVQPVGADAVLDLAALPGAAVPLAGLFGTEPPE
ncbi:MAG TPA: Uma2 family endonuclease [Acetobacteraceae bacterium]